MAHTILTHPFHGTKIAMSDEEIRMDEENGWLRYTENTPEEAAPKRKYTRKVVEQPVEQPIEKPAFLASVSDESEGD